MIRSCVLATTSNGLYEVTFGKATTVSLVSDFRYSTFRRTEEDLGLFGICRIENSSRILVAQRKNKKNTLLPFFGSTYLHILDADSFRYAGGFSVRGCSDVHQIACKDNLLFLTDTAHNRIVVVNLISKKIAKILNFGKYRKDKNHLNSVLAHKDFLLVGLNNRGRELSAIAKIYYNFIEERGKNKLADELAQYYACPEVFHSHDLEQVDDVIYSSSSKDGYVFESLSGRVVQNFDGWIRGITSDKDFIYVGSSPSATRKGRHSSKMDAKVYKVSKATWDIIDVVIIPGCGQLNDLLCLA